VSDTPEELNSKIVRRKRAFEDFYQFRNKSGKRSVDGLWKMYVEGARDGNPVPTTNREEIYRWSKEDNWDEKAARRDLGAIETDRKQYETMRVRGYDAMSLLAEEAVETLAQIMRQGEDKLRVAAAQTLLDRIGLGTQVGKKDPREKPESRLSAPPSNATDEQAAEWLSLVQGESQNYG
jgi:hypothetical protein